MTDWLRLTDLIDIVGEKAAIALISARGGESVYVPARIEERHPLADVMGLDAARALSDHLGGRGVNVMVPRANTSDWQLRRQKTAALLSAGATESMIAREMRVTTRAVQRFKQRRRGAQLKLF